MKVIEIKSEVIGKYIGVVHPSVGKKRSVHRILVPQRIGCAEHYLDFHVNEKSAESIGDDLLDKDIKITTAKGRNLKFALIEE